MNDISYAVVAVPSTLLVIGAMAGATAQITHADGAAVRRAVYVTGAALLAAAAMSGNSHAVLATGLAIAASVYVVKPIWFRGGE